MKSTILNRFVFVYIFIIKRNKDTGYFLPKRELQAGSHIFLMSCTFAGVKHLSRGWQYAWK